MWPWKKQVRRNFRYLKAQVCLCCCCCCCCCSANKWVGLSSKKKCGKGEMWSLHYQHANVLRDQGTLHDCIFFFKESVGKVKKLLLGIFICVVFTYIK